VISDNIISGNDCYSHHFRNNTGGFGGGIYRSGPGVVRNNLVTGNIAKWSGGGIMASGSPALVVRNNIVTGNSAGFGGGLAAGYDSAPLFANNIVVRNSCFVFPYGGETYGGYGGGFYSPYESSPAFTNNTLYDNSCEVEAGGAYFGDSGAAVCNNIIAFGSSGVYVPSGAIPTLKNNCVYGNAAYDYSGLGPGTGDIQYDPKLVDAAQGDLHLSRWSQCINAGYTPAVQPGWVDIDGQRRIMGGHVDIGADEWSPYGCR
jgi:hypothetical protein